MSDMESLRMQINEIDEQLVALFSSRMEVARRISEYKTEHHLPVLDAAREREVLNRVVSLAPEEMERYLRILYGTVFDLSRSYQSTLQGAQGSLSERLRQAAAATASKFPSSAVVACQGVEGAYSQLACDRLFPSASVMYFANFEGVFQAVEQGLCRYGLLPIENSSAGSVTAVYDLMERHRFSIVRGVRLQVEHCLAAPKGVTLSDVREIFSHEHAIHQCSRLLKENATVSVIPFSNTAAAAQRVADSGRRDQAAICSRTGAQRYGLEILSEQIQDSDSNYTRFICIAKQPEIYSDARKISLMMAIPHKPGSLYRIMAKFAALELNLTKLESRPILGKNFEFRFYFDLDASVFSPEVLALLDELEATVDHFVFLGNYYELV